MAGQTGIQSKLLPVEAMVAGIRECVLKIKEIGEDHDKGKLLAGGVATLCNVLRRSVLSPDEQIRVPRQLEEIRAMPEGQRLWTAYQQSGKDPINHVIRTIVA